MATAIESDSFDYIEAQETESNPAISNAGIHWSMRLMSLISLLGLGLYTYVLVLCLRRRRTNTPLTEHEERRRRYFSGLAFALDLGVSAFFSAATPLILKNGGLQFDRKHLPRPLFWFFAISGFVPTASMTLTVLGGRRWQSRIRDNPRWRRWHGLVAVVAYFSWWIACSPVLVMAFLGEKRTIELIKKTQWLNQDD